MNQPHKQLPELSEADAVALLRHHSGSCADLGDERAYSGLLLSMRAWNDKPNPEHFLEVMACIKALGPTWSSDMVQSRPVSDLWSIIYLGYSYARDPKRLQQRREYILARDELNLEERWLDCIGYAVMIFLQFNDADEAFTLYNAFIVEQRANETE